MRRNERAPATVRAAKRLGVHRRPDGWRLALPLVLLAQLACGSASEPGGSGDIQIIVNTMGGDLDQDGYTVTVDLQPHRTVPPNEPVLLRNIPAGPRAIAISDVAANCDVVTPLPRSVTVVPGRQVVAQLDVHCLTTGVRITLEEHGVDLDEDGYTLSIDGGAAVGVGKGLITTIGRLKPGVRQLVFGGTSANCQVAGGPQRSVSVTHREVTPVHIRVDCQAATGLLEIAASTSGEDLDPDGFRFRVDGGAAQPLGTGQSLLVPKLTPGLHTVELDGLSANCTLSGLPKRSFSVVVGAITPVTFEVTCARTDVIAFARGSTIMTIRGDGAGLQRVLDGETPSWSPDGTRMVYSQRTCSYPYYYYCDTFSMYTVTLGTGATKLLSPEIIGAPEWSPDGTSIAFAARTAARILIQVMAADGATPSVIDIPGLTGPATDPSWSPSGHQLVFTCWSPMGADLYFVDVTGSGFQRLMNTGGYAHSPDWSPDGTHIAFATGTPVDDGQIVVIRADGSGRRELAVGRDPAWSPDGTRLVFSRRGSEPGIYVINADGSGLVRLTTVDGDYAPAWRP
ncbi:MAG TPA: hypothetical protein VLE53_18790 [Gemmatimonadaceae bacterium]|nr:hypothetical protein [Gemmatimonadaceae bacterium]